VFNFLKSKKKKVTLVLSGGAARGIAHVGVIKAFEQCAFPIDCIQGSSVGSIVGAFYAAGIPISEIEKIVHNIKIADFIKIKLSMKALFSSEAIERFIIGKIGDIGFDACKIPLVIVATDLKTGNKKWFTPEDNDSVSLATAARASSSIPGVFSPTIIGDNHYLDGSISCHLPLHSAFKHDIVIGSNVVPNLKLDRVPKSLYSLVDRSIDYMLLSVSKSMASKFNVLLHPVIENIGSIDIKSRNKLIQFGYNSVMQRRKEIEELL
jgi:NTE family protein